MTTIVPSLELVSLIPVDVFGFGVSCHRLSPWRVRERVRSIACGGNFTALLTAEGFLRARG